MKVFHVLMCAVLPATAQVHLSPFGNDSDPGTAARPVAPLERARDLARSMASSANGDTTVYLAGGVYWLGKPFTVTAEDSGKNGHRVVYTASPGQKPIISGGGQITGWKLSDATRKLWSAPAPETLKNTRQLYINGVRAEPARGPVPVQLTQTATGYTASEPVMASWRNAGDIEFVYTGGNAAWSEPSVGIGSWTEPRCPIARIHANQIEMSQPCWDNSTQRIVLPQWKRTANLVGPKSVGAPPSYVENAFELLGRPGAWYFDRGARVIYYVPRSG